MLKIIIESRLFWVAMSCGCLAAQAGCTSALSTAALREALRETTDYSADRPSMKKARLAHAAKESHSGKADQADSSQDSDADSVASETADDQTSDTLGSSGEDATADAKANRSEADQKRLAAALDRAIERLSQVGGMNEAMQTALISTLESASPDDWPAMIDAFVSSLQSSHRTSPAAIHALLAAPIVAVVHAEPVAPAPTPVAPAPEPVAAIAIAAAPHTTAVDDGLLVAADQIEDESPALAMQNACFVSRVAAWGVVDRFPSDCFESGQDVIVYFELENLRSIQSTVGHTTRIDTVLRLVGPDGQRIHQWSFDPIVETCLARRRDYFARYLIQIPETAPTDGCRLEIAVTDTSAGTTARTTLPVAVAANAAAR